ncbi:MAG: lytic transglycosylase domain-containing protein [Gammaproteobacteria bacterium]|nr:lytic transglycosylase domain-containing protein [Gammaproteobacteria bacterium]
MDQFLARVIRPAILYRAALLCAVLALLPVTALSQVYKYTDEDGVVHYTNIKPRSERQYATLNFPCYASDPDCRAVDWEQVPLKTTLFDDEISRASARYAVDESLIRAIIHAESAYQSEARSPKGAQGLMQLMPEVQQELEVLDPYHPESNIDGGTYHLSRMLTLFDGDMDLAAAAYNAGEGAVQRHGGIPPYAETREYVRRIRILYRRYSAARS